MGRAVSGENGIRVRVRCPAWQALAGQSEDHPRPGYQAAVKAALCSLETLLGPSGCFFLSFALPPVPFKMSGGKLGTGLQRIRKSSRL